MMYAVLSLGLALLGGVIRLAQVLRLSVPLLSAVGLYGLSFALTALVFARFPLSMISPLMAGAVFVLISLFSVAFLGESLGATRIAGMACVAVGIALLARSA